MTRASCLWTATALCVGLAGLSAGAQDSRQAAARSIDARAAHYAGIAKQIWDLAEVGYQEEQSSKLLQRELTTAGFTVEAGVAGMPTGFVANFGSGKPVIGILAEFDALPGITQSDAPERTPLDHKAAGHACGHHLFGTGSVAAAIAVKEWRWLEDSPMRNVSKPKESRGRVRFLSDEERARLLDACRASENPYISRLGRLFAAALKTKDLGE